MYYLDSRAETIYTKYVFPRALVLKLVTLFYLFYFQESPCSTPSVPLGGRRAPSEDPAVEQHGGDRSAEGETSKTHCKLIITYICVYISAHYIIYTIINSFWDILECA